MSRVLRWASPQVWVIFVLVGAPACGDGQAQAEDVHTVERDGEADVGGGDVTRDVVEHETEVVSEPCVLESLYEMMLSSSAAPGVGAAFLVIYREGFCVGRVDAAEAPSPTCFEMWWEVVTCDSVSAQIRIFSPCIFRGEPFQEFVVRIEAPDPIELFTPVSLDGREFLVLDIARPSDVDAACGGYECVSTWPGADPAE